MTETTKQTKKPRRTLARWAAECGYPQWALDALTSEERASILPALDAADEAASLRIRAKWHEESAESLLKRADACDETAEKIDAVAAKLTRIKGAAQ